MDSCAGVRWTDDLGLYDGDVLVVGRAQETTHGDWAMETCVSFIAAAGRMNVDGLQLGSERSVRKSVRSGEPMTPHSRAHFIYSLLRFMLDYESWGWESLRFSPSRHLSTRDSPLFRRGVNPRVIDAQVWLKLIWAA